MSSIIGCCTYRCLQSSKIKITCSSSKGFGPQSPKKQKNNNKLKIPRKQQEESQSQAPGLNSQVSNIASELEFEERLQAIRRSALEQKKVEETTQYGPIDYDAAPIVSENKQVGFGTKLGVGIAVVVFGLVFALGDFLPATSSKDGDTVVENKLTEEEKASLKSRLEQYEKQLSISPEDPVSLEAAAVTLSELGEYDQAVSLLEKLSKEKPRDPDVYRLLGEVKYELKDYQGSVAAYKSSASVSETSNFEVLRGLTNSLLAAKKPDEAVQVLLATRERLNTAKSQGKSQVKMQDDIDPIQVDLLLGKAYSDWGHVGDAVTVYDQLISAYPEDFRGYLAKGIILKENGKTGDAERMFIQAKFFAPYKAKTLVDRYSKQ